MGTLKEYSRNGLGTDYFVSDIHGCYTLLMSKLVEVNFNFDNDRLFCSGDLIDRGSENVECLELLKEPWFFSVRGNHENLMADSLLRSDRSAFQCWINNGGRWWHFLEEDDKGKVEDLAVMVDALPYVIQIGDITLLHAEYMGGSVYDLHGELNYQVKQQLVWGRSKIDRKDDSMVEGTSLVVVGHTPVKEPTVLGNTVYIDTGGCFSNGYLTVLSEKQLRDLLKP